MNILGIDPGIATVGLGVVGYTDRQSFTCIDYATICTSPQLHTYERLQEIRKDVLEYIAEYSPEIIVVEQLFFAVNEKTIIAVAQARGVLLEACSQAQVPIIEATPLQLKQAITGDGSATKSQMQQMVQHMLCLNAIPQPDDAADALALAIYGALQAPLLTKLG